MNVLLDTSVLLRLAVASHPTHPDAVSAVHKIRHRGDQPAIVPQVLYEYWLVATRPTAQNGLGLTFQRGQDHRLPYDPASPIPIQVEESFASSLGHLGVDRIDSYLLHGPSRAEGLGADDWAVWNAMEKIHDSGRARLLGVSNVSLDQLEILCRDAKVKPRFVQNRCFAVSGWDRAVRSFCESKGIVYQGFFLLTANHVRARQAKIVTIARGGEFSD